MKMKAVKNLLRRIPSWAVLLVGMGILYLFGLHTEAIGQVQRLMLSTGIHQAELEPPATQAVAQTDNSLTPLQQETDMQLQAPDGSMVSLSSLRGKVVFLNIWATWCPPCIAEMPGIERLYQQLDKENFAFVMLSVDQGGHQQVGPFIERKGYTFPVYVPAGPIPEAFMGNSIPTTYILDPAGQIVARQEGMAEYDTPEVQDFMQSLLTKQ